MALPRQQTPATTPMNSGAALEAAHWRISGPGGAAQLLGVKPSTLAYRIKVFDIGKGRGPGISHH